MAEDKMVRWHHQLERHEFEQAPGVDEGQGSLVHCSLWGQKESRIFSSQLFASGSQSIGVSVSASVLPMSIQD